MTDFELIEEIRNNNLDLCNKMIGLGMAYLNTLTPSAELYAEAVSSALLYVLDKYNGKSRLTYIYRLKIKCNYLDIVKSEVRHKRKEEALYNDIRESKCGKVCTNKNYEDLYEEEYDSNIR